MKSPVFNLMAVTLFSAALGSLLYSDEKGLEVSSAKLGRGIEEREIAGEDSTFSVNEKVFLWMRVTGGSSDTLTVNWKIEDHTFPVSLMIGGSPWRTWANKTVWKAGEWRVVVKDTEGKLLKEMSFLVREIEKIEKEGE